MTNDLEEEDDRNFRNTMGRFILEDLRSGVDNQFTAAARKFIKIIKTKERCMGLLIMQHFHKRKGMI